VSLAITHFPFANPSFCSRRANRRTTCLRITHNRSSRSWWRLVNSFLLIKVAQWKHGGPIIHRSHHRNLALICINLETRLLILHLASFSVLGIGNLDKGPLLVLCNAYAKSHRSSCFMRMFWRIRKQSLKYTKIFLYYPNGLGRYRVGRTGYMCLIWV
jgi:hypothetical protein